ncbi:MAG: type II toxin-antitoxin system HicA family toxin [Chloroflexota bacterium]|nr:type II toxin-antitoxin system HicA family toxin [Chloroflexota bacterium]
MPSLPIISGYACLLALRKVGFIVRRQSGSHIIVRREGDPTQTISIPNHSTLDRGTLRSIIRTAGLTVDEFIALL